MAANNQLENQYYECSFPLTNWVTGNNLFYSIVSQMENYMGTLRQLYKWKQQRLLLERPTLSSASTLIFWVHKTIIDNALQLFSIQGGFKVSNSSKCLPTSSQYNYKKQSPRPRRVLLDIDCDHPHLLEELDSLDLERIRLWDHIADLYHYEIIELCTAQYIDLVVTTNERLMNPWEEWLTYLMPHRTRLFFPPPQLLKDPKVLAQAIYDRAFTIRKRKRFNSNQLQTEFFRTLELKSSENIQSK